MIDTHCHLDADRFANDRGAVLDRARERGVRDIVVPAVDEGSWSVIAAMASIREPQCHATIGIHPIAVPFMDIHGDDAMLERMRVTLRAYHVVAIGECGLDDTIAMDKAPYDRQERLLAAQFAIADEHNLPVILHARARGAYDRLLEFLRENPLPRAGGVLHSYGGSIDLLKHFQAFDLYFGFAGPATYRNARKVRTSVVAVADDRLLAETDAPDQTPEPHRPGRSEPAYVGDVIQGLAAARGISFDACTALTTANAQRLFKL
ncbi:MAG: TatD family hydrolase [Clostridia bacterium]|nr:TatD family hydrolase [Deltaproteobacteria bacterium]